MSACVIPLNKGVDLGRVSGIKSLRPFPAVACKLLSLMSDDDANFRKVSELLTTDTALSGQVLRVANSALFGFRQEVKNILQALCLVGANRVRDLVVTVSLRNYIGRNDAEALRACWRHNLATALWSEALSRWYKLDGPMSYTAGLLHDLGRITLLMLLPEDYASFLEQSDTSGTDCRTVERELFDFDHCQVGHYLSRLWNFQPVFTDVIGHHHDELTSETPRTRVLAQAACVAASMSGFHTVGPARTWEPARIAALSPNVGKGASPPMDRLLQKVIDELNLIECSLL